MSWNGTVRCSNCYESGHNRTGCPELKKAWEKDPESYLGRQWARIIQTKAKPKTCSYCNETGHTRPGCADLKIHKQAYREDVIIFRQAMAKWMRESGLGIGALVRAKDAQYYTEKGYVYPRDDKYVPPVGLIIDATPSVDHYGAISGSQEWMNNGGLLSMQLLASADMEQYQRNVGLGLPCIPGIVPRLGKDWYDSLVDRVERCSNIDWEVVSPGYKDFDSTDWVSAQGVAPYVKEHFARNNEQSARNFQRFTPEQKEQLRDYVNGDIELFEMKDAELPDTDT